MKISVITPCINSEKYIEETIESVLNQRGNFEIEYIIVDGESTDKTVPTISKYRELVESGEFPIKCRKVSINSISERDEGMYDALAKGFKLVTGDIIAYINSDDFYLPNAFSIVVDIFKNFSEVDWVTGMQTSYNEKGQIINCFLPFKYSKKFIRKGIHGTILPFIQQESTFWRRNLLNQLDFNLLRKYKFAGDFYMWYAFSKKAALYVVEGCLGGFRSRTGQVSERKKEYFREFYSIADRRAFLDTLFAHVCNVVTYTMPNIIKRKLNRKFIYYEKGMWKTAQIETV